MNLIERAKNILITPKKEWDVIAGEEQSLSTVLTTYVIPLALIGAAANLIGWGLIGKSFGTGFYSITVKGWDIGIKYAIIYLVSVIVGVLVSAFVVDALAPSFGSEKNLNKSSQFVAYAYTPSLVAAALNILPVLGMVAGLIGLYSIYLLYIGLSPMKKTPEDKKVIYLVITFVVMIAVYVVLGLILASILGMGGIGSASSISL